MLAHVFAHGPPSYNPMEDIARTIDALTSLIAINYKRYSAYQSLAEKAQQHELKTLFLQFAEQSKRFVGSLSTWRAAYGGFGVADKKAGTSAWSQLKFLLGLNSVRNRIDECKELEQEAIKIYQSTISMAFLPAATVADIHKQMFELEKSLSKLRSIEYQSMAGERLIANNATR
jgi:uncharacterized protein (TIGR02284 family)